MTRKILPFVLALLLPATLPAQTVRSWTLSDCISYALAHNIQLRKQEAGIQSSRADVAESKAAWLPSLSVGVSQALQYRPFQENASSFVNGNLASSAADKATQSGNYGINAAWTVWDGGTRQLNISSSELSLRQSELQLTQQANSIQEELTTLYVQILYLQEAVDVNRTLLQQDSIVLERGRQMLQQGQISKADLAQLESQLSSGLYNVVNAETQVANYTLQLKQLLELGPTDEISLAAEPPADASCLTPIPAKLEVYESALRQRPEVKSGELAVEQSKLQEQIARRGYLPTVNLTGGVGDSHVTGGNQGYFQQMKQNFNANVGLSLSIPILDNRQTKSRIERAQAAGLTSQLDLEDTRKQLYERIETYWLNATNGQAKFRAATANVQALQTSYDLTQEQFRLGLKNIVELLTSRASLLNARQELLQDKYTTVLNRTLLDFYAGKEIQL